MEVKLLDHGYVKLVETWGSDHRIIEAARMSTDKGFLGWEPIFAYRCLICPYTCEVEEALPDNTLCPNQCLNGTSTLFFLKGKSHAGDTKLLRYLWEHKHHTPFEMGGAIFEVQAPLMVFREWHRHRTQSYNELSGRYTQLPDLYYIPSIERLKAGKQATKNKQGSEEGFNDQEAWEMQEVIRESTTYARGQYEAMLKWGVSKELARLVIPVNQYSRMRASANLRNWLGFLSLRLDPAAQWEIRQYANAVHDILQESFPRTMELFDAN